MAASPQRDNPYIQINLTKIYNVRKLFNAHTVFIRLSACFLFLLDMNIITVFRLSITLVIFLALRDTGHETIRVQMHITRPHMLGLAD